MGSPKIISTDELVPFGKGVQRPEDVVITKDGEVWLSDQASACARVERDGSLTRVGRVKGAPNGINMDVEGRILIANFGSFKTKVKQVLSNGLDIPNSKFEYVPIGN